MSRIFVQTGLVPLIEAVIDTQPVSRAGAGSIGPLRHKRIHRKMTAPASALGAGLLLGIGTSPSSFGISIAGGASAPAAPVPGAEPTNYAKWHSSVPGRTQGRKWPVCVRCLREVPRSHCDRADYREKAKNPLVSEFFEARLPVALL